MDYDFSEGLLEKAFDAVEEYAHFPIQDDEFTATMMAEKHPCYEARHWRTILKQAAEDGVLEMREAKGGALAFKIVEGEELDVDAK